MNVADTLFELEQAQLELRAAEELRLKMAEDRNVLVLKALKLGVRPVDLAKLTGLTTARMAQLRK